MKIQTREIFLYIGLLFLLSVAFFETQILILNAFATPFILLFAVLMFMMAYLKNGKLYCSKSIPSYLYLWFLLIPFFLYGLIKNESNVSVKIIICLVFVYLVMMQSDWISIAKKVLIVTTGISVFFTLYFFIFPYSYSIVEAFYGYFPAGTGSLKTGYRAGISAHYSMNGLSISIFLMTSICTIISSNSKRISRIKKAVAISVIVAGLFALILNSKRGILVWCLCAIIGSYFISSERKSRVVSRILVVIGVFVVALQLLSESIPGIEYFFGRFLALGNDSGSLERFDMWRLAIKSFQESPLLGIGFMNFRGLYSTKLFGIYGVANGSNALQRLDAHNVYLQLLCETGIVGFGIYMAAVLLLFISTMKLTKYYVNHEDKNLRFGVLFSLCLQIFYLLYSLAGNCLYDSVFYFYALAIAMTSSLHINKKNEQMKG